jgi:hypothetical protein
VQCPDPRSLGRIGASALALIVATAAADTPRDEPTVLDVADAPRPGRESGRADDATPRVSAVRKLGRAVLFVPRAVLEIAFAPLRLGIWAYERFSARQVYERTFFNDEMTMGVYPTVSLQSGFGATLGGRFVHRDLFGEREKVSVHAATGGRYRERIDTTLESGRRFGPLRIRLDGDLERRPKETFFGIGNSSSGEARYRVQVLRAIAMADLRVTRTVSVRAAGVLADFDYGRSDEGPAIDELYPPEAMVGFEGVQQGYGELELRYDTRRHVTVWEVPPVKSSGWLLSGFLGHANALDTNADFQRAGIDLQRFFRIGAGPRVLAARLHGELVTGSRDEVPFAQLPRLGGDRLLRGYAVDRFRDRVAAVSSLEYSWDLSRNKTASLFVDAGRVFPELEQVLDVRALRQLRVGYGLALAMHTEHSFVARATLASTIDGGVFVSLAFDPPFELEPRVERE